MIYMVFQVRVMETILHFADVLQASVVIEENTV